MNAMILAAGRGTRLGALGLRTPKVLVEVDGAPLLLGHLRYFEQEGIARVVINAHHLADQVDDFLRAYEGPLDVELVVEDELLGTAGGVLNALDLLGDEPFVVLYGDVLVREPLPPLIDRFRRLDASALLTVYEADNTLGKGVVEVGRDGRVAGFREKKQEGPGLVNAGLYVLARHLLTGLPSRVALDFGADVLPAAVRRGERVFAYRLAESVLDLGTPEALRAARVRADQAATPDSDPGAQNLAVGASKGAVNPTSFSVVICAYSDERWADTLAAIQSVERQSYPAEEIILVVDHNPQLLDRARTLEPRVTVVSNSHVRGLGGARNSGVDHASGDVVAFLDDDAVASARWLADLAGAYVDDAVLGAGGSIHPVWAAGRPSWFPPEFDWVVGCTYEGMPTSPASVRNLIGCNMSYRRETFEVLGGFRLGYGCDETEFCIRIGRRWGSGSLRYVPSARVDHRVGSDRTRWRHFVSRCYFEGGSKAVVSWLLSSGEALKSERTYAFKTLPRAFWLGIAGAVVHREPERLAKASAIVVGLLFTATGYCSGRLSPTRQAHRRGWDSEIGSTTADEDERLETATGAV